MQRSKIQTILNDLNTDIELIKDQKAKSVINTLINLIEILVNENDSLRRENKNLKNEISRLKGEQGTPKIREQKKHGNSDHSSEEERHNRSGKKPRKPKNKKKNTIKIHRRVKCEVDQKLLPDDAQFKGYETSTIQDIKITPDNVEFHREIWYSPSLKKSFLAPLPDGYQGEFGPSIRALVISLHEDSKMTEKPIARFFKTFGITISLSTISRMITDKHEAFHQEKEDIVDAGLNSTKYQHMDDTGCRVNGKNYYTHVLCNPYFTAYFTRPKKDRLTILEILCRGELKFTLNQNAFQLMKEHGLSDKRIKQIKHSASDNPVDRQTIDDSLAVLFPNPKKNIRCKRIILEAAALTYYNQSGIRLEHLMVDDAPQYNMIATHKSLCWIHDGRHYKKLRPMTQYHRKVLDNFVEAYWDFYHDLLQYKQQPTDQSAMKLSQRFDELFTTVTGYTPLDERIAKTLAKKDALLLILQYPFLPLENNPAELGARVQARARDINLQTRNQKGTESKDTFATLAQTARKLGVNFYKYVYDRISKRFEMPSLAKLILDKAETAPDTS